MGQSQDDNTNLEEVMLVLQQDVLGPDFGEAAEKNLIAGAKKLWTTHCSRVRASGPQKRVARWDKSIPRTGVCFETIGTHDTFHDIYPRLSL